MRVKRATERGREWETGPESRPQHLSHTHIRTRSPAAVWSATSIFCQISETDSDAGHCSQLASPNRRASSWMADPSWPQLAPVPSYTHTHTLLTSLVQSLPLSTAGGGGWSLAWRARKREQNVKTPCAGRMGLPRSFSTVELIERLLQAEPTNSHFSTTNCID